MGPSLLMITSRWQVLLAAGADPEAQATKVRDSRIIMQHTIFVLIDAPHSRTFMLHLILFAYMLIPVVAELSCPGHSSSAPGLPIRPRGPHPMSLLIYPCAITSRLPCTCLMPRPRQETVRVLLNGGADLRAVGEVYLSLVLAMVSALPVL